jgi:hypothetical protein
MGVNYAGDCAWASVAGIKVIAVAAMLQIEALDDGPRQRSPAFGSHRIFLFRATPDGHIRFGGTVFGSPG